MRVQAHVRVLDAFAAAFDGPPHVVSRAPGRVNIIGEHTDYNDGFVLPCAIGIDTFVAARSRDDGIVNVAAADLGGAVDHFEIRMSVQRSATKPWANYVRGVFSEMRRAGFEIGGADLAVAGDVPQGAGLSSSAALEMATALAVAALAGQPDADRTALAQVCQRAENDFVGCQCGIMDQLVSARGVAGSALLIDCRTLACRAVPASPDVAILIIHSGVVHGHVESHYNERRRQCEEAAAVLGVGKLRDADETMLAARSGLFSPVTFRRARHVIIENERTVAAANSFASGDLKSLGELMRASHRSMRDDFEITTPNIDRLVDLVNEAIGPDGGARMTGGGFGGSVVALAPAAAAQSVAKQVAAGYARPDGRPTEVLIEKPCAGASLIG